MRITGKITAWKDDKGFGFITPSSGAKQVFVHISEFTDRRLQPQINQLVTFSLSTDKQGRPCAVKVSKVGERVPWEIKRNDRYFYILTAIVFLAVVGLSVVAGDMPAIILFIYLGASLLTFFMYFWDKSDARTGAWRKQESTLHTLALLERKLWARLDAAIEARDGCGVILGPD